MANLNGGVMFGDAQAGAANGQDGLAVIAVNKFVAAGPQTCANGKAFAFMARQNFCRIAGIASC